MQNSTPRPIETNRVFYMHIVSLKSGLYARSQRVLRSSSSNSPCHRHQSERLRCTVGHHPLSHENAHRRLSPGVPGLCLAGVGAAQLCASLTTQPAAGRRGWGRTAAAHPLTATEIASPSGRKDTFKEPTKHAGKNFYRI